MTAAIYKRDGQWHVEATDTTGQLATVYSSVAYEPAYDYWYDLLHPKGRRSGRAHPPKSAP